MSRAILSFGVAIFLLTCVYSTAARQITIKVVNGHDGKPLRDTTVYIWFGTKALPPPTQVTTTNDGSASLTVPDSVETIVIAAERVADCRAGKQKSYIEENAYHIQDILRTGAVAQNTCGKASNQATPGVLV